MGLERTSLLRLTRRTLLTGLAAGMLWPGSLPARAADRGPPPLADEFAEHFSLRTTPLPAIPEPFLAPGGGRVTLADFRGKVVLLNFWATWCAPCVVEMPALDRLQAALGGRGLQVLAVSQDLKGEPVAAAFLAQHGLANLAPYSDPKGRLADAFGIRGLPTTLLIDPAGMIVGGLEGPAEWDSPAGQALIAHYLPPATSAT